MTKECKQQFTLRITQANPTQLVVILYEMCLEYLKEAEETLEKKNIRIRRFSQGCVGAGGDRKSDPAAARRVRRDPGSEPGGARHGKFPDCVRRADLWQEQSNGKYGRREPGSACVVPSPAGRLLFPPVP